MPSGVILAGGRSTRMGGGHKALLALAGRPLLQHVIDRSAPQVGRLLLSVEQVDATWEPFRLVQVADPEPGHRGPLGGLVAALESAACRSDWMLLLPCDAPFLPTDLAPRLLAAALAARRPGAVIRLEGKLQPTFSLWHRELAPPLGEAVRGLSMGGFKAFLDRCPLAVLDWTSSPPRGPSPFFNVNTPADLAQAEAWLAPGCAERAAC